MRRARSLCSIGYHGAIRVEGHSGSCGRSAENQNRARISPAARAPTKVRTRPLRASSARTRYVGEVGLDGAPEFKPHWADQTMAFGRILELCEQAGGRTLSIHSRRAASAVLDQLEGKRGAGTAILHWFSGTAGELGRAITLGCWFSVGPAMLATEKGRALTAKMPRDRLLTETDGPFAQMRGTAAVPWDTAQVIPILGHIWNEPSAGVERQLIANLRRLTTKV